MAYYLDDQQANRPVGQVVLDPSLAAKLTTESYSLNFDCTAQPVDPGWPKLPAAGEFCDPAVKGNPHTVFDDPEFQLLNNDCQPWFESASYSCGAGDFTGADGFGDSSGKGNVKDGDFLPTVLGPPSDLTFQLTDWIGADADAAGFLAGKKDLWGMRVNTNYKDISYPTDQFQTQMDPGATNPGSTCNFQNGACDSDATMQVEWNPDQNLDLIANNLVDLQTNADQTSLSCPLSQGCTSIGEFGFAGDGQQAPTARALFSELDLGDVAADQFPAASVENSAGDAVAPTQVSVEAAVKDMKTNPDGITQF